MIDPGRIVESVLTTIGAVERSIERKMTRIW